MLSFSFILFRNIYEYFLNLKFALKKQRGATLTLFKKKFENARVTWDSNLIFTMRLLTRISHARSLSCNAVES